MNPMQRLAESDKPKRKSWVYRWEPKAGPCPWLIRCAREPWVKNGVEHKGMSQHRLADLIGLSPTSGMICLIESYRLPVTDYRLGLISAALNCNPGDLCAKTAQEAADNHALYLRWVADGKPDLRGWIRALER